MDAKDHSTACVWFAKDGIVLRHIGWHSMCASCNSHISVSSSFTGIMKRAEITNQGSQWLHVHLNVRYEFNLFKEHTHSHTNTRISIVMINTHLDVRISDRMAKLLLQPVPANLLGCCCYCNCSMHICIENRKETLSNE